ncbi:unnamed protein product [Debaryomyces tyrocola]|nr:unnamed protein product [Debaryomyces tyrocola]
MKVSRESISELNKMSQDIINKKTLNFNNEYIKISNMNHEIVNLFERKSYLILWVPYIFRKYKILN